MAGTQKLDIDLPILYIVLQLQVSFLWNQSHLGKMVLSKAENSLVPELAPNQNERHATMRPQLMRSVERPLSTCLGTNG